MAHEEAEQIRARIVCTPAYKCVAGVGLIPALTEVTISLLQWGIDRFAQANAVGVAETGVNTFLFLSFSFFSDKRKEL